MPGNKQIVLVKRPEGMVDASCFDVIDGDVPSPGPDEFLVRASHLIIDPAIRGWLNERGSGYLPGVEIGAPVRGSGIGEVIESNVADYPIGTVVTNMSHWQEYSIATNDQLNRPFDFATKTAAGADPMDVLTVLTSPGWTAYAAVTRLLCPTPDDRVLVTGASSIIGSLAGQMAKRAGAFVVGTAGSDEKCEWLTSDMGFDACINYRSENLDQRIKGLFPTGTTAVLDNVGGETLDILLRRIAVGARIVLVGTVSQDNNDVPYRLANYDRLMSRRATMMGFNTIDHMDIYGEATEYFATGLADGTVSYRVNVLHGLESAPEGLIGLYGESAPGKTIIKL
jgi:NADPH-dependent curcumin reductase CurA